MKTGKKRMKTIIRKFEELAEKKHEALREAGLTCICGKCDLATFTLKEIKEILNEDKF